MRLGDQSGPERQRREGGRTYRIFEHVHKSTGYLLILLATAAILSGLWVANAPVWMWIALAAWWCVQILVFAWLQRSGYAVDTYQAIWGPDSRHPGNGMKPIGWGIRRRP